MPEQVDWLGQRTQIDLAKKHGLQQVRLGSAAARQHPAQHAVALGIALLLLLLLLLLPLLGCGFGSVALCSASGGWHQPAPLLRTH